MGRRRRVPDIAGRVTSLEAALESGGAQLEPDAVAYASAVLGRTGERLTLGADTTVVALVGATGSGKSSLFNALAGMEISDVGARRPTTSKAMACVWSSDGADLLLDWLDVPRRHRTARETVLDADREASLHGLVLLDLPDHDSTVVAHRLEVDRLVELVDLLVWVVDPQKYADEALHAGYLKRLQGHDSVMLVVLNQIDRLPEGEVDTCRRDLRRLLDADGLEAVRLLTASARRGDGVEKLRSVLAEVVGNQAVVVERAAADLDAATRGLEGGVAPVEIEPERLDGAEELLAALSHAAGVPVVLEAVAADYRRRAAGYVGWPFTRWVRRLRPDPLKRLRLGAVEEDVRRLSRSSLPAATPSQRARVELAVRTVTAQAADQLPQRWSDAVREAATPPEEDLSDALDAAVMRVDLDHREPFWWRGVGALQLLLAACTVIGFVWLAVLGVLGWLQLPPTHPPFIGPLPVPTALLLGGLVFGLVLAVVGRWAASVGARRRRDTAAARLREAIRAVAHERVLAPVTSVLLKHRATRQALAGER